MTIPVEPKVFPPPDAEASQVKYAHGQIQYTKIVEEEGVCPVCRGRTLVSQHLMLIDIDGSINDYGCRQDCTYCQPEAFVSHMPAIMAREAMRARYVT